MSITPSHAPFPLRNINEPSVKPVFFTDKKLVSAMIFIFEELHRNDKLDTLAQFSLLAQLSTLAQLGFRFLPEPQINPSQFHNTPEFSRAKPQETHKAKNFDTAPANNAQSAFVQKASSAVNGIQKIASKFDTHGKTQKQQLAVEQHLHAFQQAKTPAEAQETYEQLKTSLRKLYRKVSLLLHPDRKPTPEASEAFKQFHGLLEQFANAKNAATQ